jgi:hypothetical protein
MGNIRELKPIETQFKGYRFRSRTEARWAIFFEQISEITGNITCRTFWSFPRKVGRFGTK